jgi:hypothetical protein
MVGGGLAICRSRGLVNGVDKDVVSFVSCAYLGMHHKGIVAARMGSMTLEGSIQHRIQRLLGWDIPAQMQVGEYRCAPRRSTWRYRPMAVLIIGQWFLTVVIGCFVYQQRSITQARDLAGIRPRPTPRPEDNGENSSA